MTTSTKGKGPTISTILVISVAVAINLVIAKLMAQWSYSWFPPQASSAAAYVDDLFALETGIGSFIFFGCTGFMGWVLLFNRAGKYDESDGELQVYERAKRFGVRMHLEP